MLITIHVKTACNLIFNIKTKILKLNKQITLFSLLFIFLVGLSNYNNIFFSYKRSVHSDNLKNSSIKSTYSLTKLERKKINLPPNKYQEKMWELSMNPITGKTEIDNLFETQYEINKSRNLSVKSFSFLVNLKK